jgi:hypothetical protein
LRADEAKKLPRRLLLVAVLDCINDAATAVYSQ